MKIFLVRILDISNRELEELSLLVNSRIKYKIDNLINKNDKLRTLIGWILVYIFLAKALKIKPKDIRVATNEYGKPYLLDYPNVYFNISHSGDYVVCAIDGKPIGIDIEKIDSIDYEEIIEEFFTASEANYIYKENYEGNLDKFYEIWTLKESYIKCCGIGLTIPLKSFSIEISGNNVNLINNDITRKYIFEKLNVDSNYKMAICSLNDKITENVSIINQNELIKSYQKLITACQY